SDGFSFLLRRRRAFYRDIEIEQDEYPVRGNDRRLQDVKLIRQVADRLEQILRILDEKGQDADCHDLFPYSKSSNKFGSEGQDHQVDADGHDEIDYRIEDRVVIDRLNIGVSIIVVDVLDPLFRLALGVEELHRLSSRDVFLQECVQLCVACTDLVKAGS